MFSGDLSIIIVLLAIAVPIGLFVLFRAFVLWYWKIDRIVLLLEEIVRLNGGSVEELNTTGGIEKLNTTDSRYVAEKQAFYKRHENEVNDPVFWIQLEWKAKNEQDEEKFQDYRRGYIPDEQYQAAKKTYYASENSEPKV